MAAVQSVDVRASFLFMGDLNGHYQEWSGSITTNHQGFPAHDFTTASGCDQLVTGPTHARGRTLDLLMADVPDVVRVAVVAPLGRSNHSSLSAAISMAQAIPNFINMSTIPSVFHSVINRAPQKRALLTFNFTESISNSKLKLKTMLRV